MLLKLTKLGSLSLQMIAPSDGKPHASALQCWSVCRCECTQNAFPLRSYILCKQENYRSFLMSDHSHFLLWHAVQAEGGLSIEDRTPDPALCGPGGKTLARAVALCREMRKRTYGGSLHPSCLFRLHSKMWKKASASYNSSQIREKLQTSQLPCEASNTILGSVIKNKSLLLRGQIIQEILRQGRREQAECVQSALYLETNK